MNTSLKLIPYLLRHSKAHIVLSVLVGVVSGGCSAALMAIINSSMNSGRDAGGGLVWRFVGLVIAVLIFSFGSRLLLINLSLRVTFELRMHLCREVAAAPLRRLEEVGVHRVLAALTQDVNVIAGTLLNIPALFINLAIVLGSMVYLGWLSINVLLALLFFLALSLTTVEIIQRRGMAYMKLARDEWDKLVKHFRALTEGMKELKLHHQRREAFLSEFIELTARTGRTYENDAQKLYAVANSTSQVLYFIFIGIVLFTMPRFQEITVQTMSGYILTVLYLRAPIIMLLELAPAFKNASISLKKIEDLGVSLTGLGAKESQSKLAHSVNGPVHVALKDVQHSFYHERDERNFVLGPLDLTFAPGELVFLIGGNGSGKTTFAKLLSGLYVPEAGEIRMDGELVNDENRERYRQYFSVVFSDFYVFEQLLGLASPNLDRKASEYLSLLQLDHKVAVKDGELSTTELSRGQRKRLALLTAYLEDRPVYIFDEWAADQDPTFKEIFYLQLLPELQARGKTTIVISHDDKYYYVADRVI